MLEHTKIICVIRTSFLRHWMQKTHILCWKSQRFDQNISFEASKALDSHSILEHTKVWLDYFFKTLIALDLPTILENTKIVWMISTFLLRTQRHWTYPLCQNMQRLLKWLAHHFWEIRGTKLTRYIETCKSYLIDQQSSFETSETLNLQSILEHTKVNQNIFF